MTRAAVALLLLLNAAPRAFAGAAPAPPDASNGFEAARLLFYNGQYAEAAACARALPLDEQPLAVYELRTSALLFQLRRAVGEPADKAKAFKACEECPALLD